MPIDPKELLKHRFLELAEKSVSEGYLTFSPFLTLEEQGYLEELAYEGKADVAHQKLGSASYLLFGGYPDSERKVLFTFPDYFPGTEMLSGIKEGHEISLLHIEGKKAEFALALTHRDYLGALMALGYKREMIGDIVVVGKEAYAYVFTSIASEIQKNLLSVGAMRVKVSVLAPQDIEVSPSFTERLINVASLRLDAIIGEVYHLDRNSSKEAILHQEVSVSGVFTDQASLLLKGNERITYKGHGKFQYLGEVGTSRKGRILAKVKIYR
jgi:RNA-binding protein YlmH